MREAAFFPQKLFLVVSRRTKQGNNEQITQQDRLHEEKNGGTGGDCGVGEECLVSRPIAGSDSHRLRDHQKAKRLPTFGIG